MENIFIGWSPILFAGMGLVFMLGAVLGSFLNVVLYRTEKKQNWVRDRSKCESCGRQIAWYENVPLLSWLALRGQCRTCHMKIDWVHPLMELLMGLWFSLVYIGCIDVFGFYKMPWNWVEPLFWLGIGILLILVVIIDGKKKIIPDWLNIILLIWVGLYLGVETWGGVLSIQDLLIRVGVGLGVGLVFLGLHFLVLKIYGRDGFGLGDVKLLAILGFLLGWPKIVVMTFLAFMLGAIGGVMIIIIKKKGRKTEVPFGPFISLATALSIIWGQYLWNLLFF